jgi:energy-coupling factor transporter ATP-binding protein EcfA2
MTQPKRMPYPGLRPFEAEDEPIFFGREAQVSGMLRRLEDHRFVAVVGSSGCGKSSLVRAGLLPALDAGFLMGTTAWVSPVIKPGAHPYEHLAHGLAGANRAAYCGVAASSNDCGTADEVTVVSILRRSDLGLLEALKAVGVADVSNVLLVIDQFEELFAFRRTPSSTGAASRDEAAAFVSMLLRSCANPTGRLWIVLTMRSDFIGDCEAFLGLPELISRTQFLVPRLDRAQMEEAIVRPGSVYEPFGFADGLVNRIINEAGDRPDQLPLMQHALMRTWKLAVARSTRAGAAVQLSHADYEEAGGIENALSLDADRAWDEVKTNPRQARIARQLFLLLCDISPDGQITRRRPTVGEVEAATGATREEVAQVVAPFQNDDRNFLLPPVDRKFTSTTTLDISHEALLRRWQLFANEWQQQEQADASELRRVTDLARLHKEGRSALLQGQDLDRIVRWRANVSPEWASRYVRPDRWAEAETFLDASVKVDEAQKAAAAKARRRVQRRNQWISATLAATVVALVALILASRYLYVWDSSAEYMDFVKVNGEPKGIRLLSASEVAHRPVSIRIVRKGTRGPVQRMEAINSRGEPTPRHSIGNYLSNTDETTKAARWDFVYGADKRVAYELAFDKRGQQLSTLIYSPPRGTGKKVRLAHFVGPDGYPHATPGYGNGFAQIEYSSEGYESLITYRNAAGEQRAGLDKAFGRRQEFDAEGRLTKLVSVDPRGQPMIDEAGNAGLTIKYDAKGNPIEQMATDAKGTITTLKDGYASGKSRFDASGNLTEETYFDENGAPTEINDGYHRSTQALDDRGRTVELSYWDVKGKPAVDAEGCHRQRYTYDERDNATTATCIGIAEKAAPNKKGVTVLKMKYDDNGNLADLRYTDASGRAVTSSKGYSQTTFKYDVHGHSTETAYFDTDGKPVTTEQGYFRVVSEYDGRDNVIANSYYGADGRPTLMSEPDDANGHVSTYASWRRQYDANGNIVSQAYFDEHGQPTLGTDGYAMWRNRYDESGNRIEVAYFGLKGEHVFSKDHYAVWTIEYDSLGRQIGGKYFDPQGAPVASNEGYASWRSQLDEQSNEIERRFFGIDGKPVLTTSGYGGWRAEYDRRGNQTVTSYFDTHGKPVLLWNRESHTAYARMVRHYDARARIIEEECFGVRGERVLGPRGAARIVNRYELSSEEAVATAYYGTDNKPKRIAEGWHAVARQLDQYGRATEITYFDEHGRPSTTAAGYARLKKQYDAYGHNIEQAIFAPDGSPVTAGAGEHRWIKRFDERGRLLEQRWFGPHGEPIQVWGQRQHQTKYGYDDRGDLIRIENFDVAGKPVVGPGQAENESCAVWTASYDRLGKKLTSRCEK